MNGRRTNDCLKNITPDSVSGIIFALEGISNTVVLLNGPTGCKFYHGETSIDRIIKQVEYDPLNYPEKWYFKQPRIPSTYLDSYDYIYGSKEKLEELLVFLRNQDNFELLCIVNSPGASLIGDDLVGIVGGIIKDTPYIVIETPGFSSDICSGYETAAIALLDQLQITKENEKCAGTVNLLGLSIYHRNYKGDIEEIQRLMNLCGISVNCSLCTDCNMGSIRTIPSAELRQHRTMAGASNVW